MSRVLGSIVGESAAFFRNVRSGIRDLVVEDYKDVVVGGRRVVG